jgi:hypothetical protein
MKEILVVDLVKNENEAVNVARFIVINTWAVYIYGSSTRTEFHGFCLVSACL